MELGNIFSIIIDINIYMLFFFLEYSSEEGSDGVILIFIMSWFSILEVLIHMYLLTTYELSE